MVEDRNNVIVVLVSILRISVWRLRCPSGTSHYLCLYGDLLYACCVSPDVSAALLALYGFHIEEQAASAESLHVRMQTRRVPSGEDPTCQQSASLLCHD